MKDLLKEAFTRAARGLDMISDTFDKAGFWVWRAMMDETFLSTDHLKFESPALRRAADVCDWAKEKAQGYVYKDLMNKGATGNVGPKPNYKPVLFKAFEAATPHIARMNIASPAVTALSLAVIAAGAYMFTHNGSSHVVPEMVATWYSANGGEDHGAPSPQ